MTSLKSSVRRTRLVQLLTLSSALAFSACGGGGKSENSNPNPVVNQAVGRISGKALSSTDSSAIAGAEVSAAGVSTQTGADGSFTLEGVPVSANVVVRIAATNFMDGFVNVALPEGQTAQTAARLIAISTATAIDPATVATVKAPNSVAQVTLAAGSIINPATGQAPVGKVNVQVTPIDPARDPQTMPGDYTNANNERIESFGAVNVLLKDAAGAPLNLKPGSTAEIEIAPASRSANLPATIPLFYFNETTGRWVQEGSATLTGTGETQVYKGTVTHFSTWNADRVQDSIVVNGCVNDAQGRPIKNNDSHYASTQGIDYSGSAVAYITDGKFSVSIKKSGMANLFVESYALGTTSNTVVVGPSATDITLPTCLVMSDVLLPPTIVSQPEKITVLDGDVFRFMVTTSGARSFQYQWYRNGVALTTANAKNQYYYANAILADSGAVYTVKITNSVGEVTSAKAVLTVNPKPLTAPQISRQPASISTAPGTTATFSVQGGGYPEPTYQWRRNGVNIAGATKSDYTTATLTLADTGASFSVVLTNSQGSRTSSAASLTVTQATINEKQVAAIRLFDEQSNLYDYSNALPEPDNLVCKSGSVSNVTQKMNPAAGVLYEGGVTFNDCLALSGSRQRTFSGTLFQTILVPVSGVYTVTDQFTNFRAKPNADLIKKPADDFTITGSRTSTTSVVPTAGSAGLANAGSGSIKVTMAPNTNVVSQFDGSTWVFNGGSVETSSAIVNLTASSVEARRTVAYNNLSFTQDGVTYVANGSHTEVTTTNGGLSSATSKASGEVTVTANGNPIAKIFVNVAPDKRGVISIQIDGGIVPMAPK
jgi:hypothetical protein